MAADQPRLLHITNGDSAADIIAACGVGGDVLPWRDPMHHGPFLAGLSLDELSRVRIDYLSGNERSVQESVQGVGPHGFSERNATLANSPNYDQIVLWFEHDLLDQLQILQLLDWFASADIADNKLFLICIDHYDGVPDFRGIGQLTQKQMKALFESRQPTTSLQLTLAQHYWSAYCLDEPQTLLNLLAENSATCKSVTPFLEAALMRHCQEFPWVSDGLTRTERQLLKLVGEGVTEPVSLFVRNMELETHLYIGDWRTYSQIAQLCRSEFALLACVSGAQFMHPSNAILPSDEFNNQQLCLTDHGKRVLDGCTNAVDTLKRNCWLGGVHLNSYDAVWFWDEPRQVFHLAPMG